MLIESGPFAIVRTAELGTSTRLSVTIDSPFAPENVVFPENNTAFETLSSVTSKLSSKAFAPLPLKLAVVLAAESVILKRLKLLNAVALAVSTVPLTDNPDPVVPVHVFVAPPLSVKV
jgi:hypothetical protein